MNRIIEFEGKIKELTINDRLSWDEYFMSLCVLTASRSPSKKLKVGALIVKNNRIISSGYNGFPSGLPHISIERDNHEQNTIHAEQNAISDAAKRGVSVNESTIYITHYPCINCLKYILSSGISTIKYLHDYKNDEIIPKIIENTNLTITKYL